jgi:hypothetical protein
MAAPSIVPAWAATGIAMSANPSIPVLISERMTKSLVEFLKANVG